jgi:regulator of protease activity HflC (stomatin/prohibitin superfamily)
MGLLIGLLIFFHSFAVVGPNQVGVVETASYIDKGQTPLGPGWHNIVPFQQSVAYVTTNQQSHAFAEVYTGAKNQQAVYIDGTISYRVDPAKAGEFTIQTAGSDDPNILINRILWPAFQDYIKEVVPTYDDYQTAFLHRSDIRETVKKKLQGKTDQFGLYVDDVFLTNVHPEVSYQAAVNAAATAQQDKLRAQNEAAAKVATAQGDADANRIRQSSITQQTLDQEALDNTKAAIARWDGHMPTVTGGGIPFININPAPPK